MFSRPSLTPASRGLLALLFLIIAVELSTGRYTDARNHHTVENERRTPQRETLQVTEVKQYPWKRSTHLGWVGQQSHATLKTNRFIKENVTSVHSRERRRFPKKFRKKGKHKRRSRRGRRKRDRRHVNSANTRMHWFHCVPNISATFGMARGSCKPLWNATVCANRTLITSEPGYVLRFWDRPKAEIPKPFAFKSEQAALLGTGRLMIFQAGLYQLYTQILFLDNWFRTVVSIEVNKKPEFKCVHDVGDLKPGEIRDHYYNTCSINAVKYLKTNDVVTVNIPYRQSIIDMHADSTYFGFVLLSS